MQGWGSEESIQQLPVQQQAYMTAALVQSLQLLGKQQLEHTPGLFPALLSGVSTRLGSPEGPLRHVHQLKRFTPILHSQSLLLLIASRSSVHGAQDTCIIVQFAVACRWHSFVRGLMMMPRTARQRHPVLEIFMLPHTR